MILYNVSFLLCKNPIKSHPTHLQSHAYTYLLHERKHIPPLLIISKVNGGFWFSKVRDTKNSDTRAHLCAHLRAQETWSLRRPKQYVGIRYNMFVTTCAPLQELSQCWHDPAFMTIWPKKSCLCTIHVLFLFLLFNVFNSLHTYGCFLKIILRNEHHPWVQYL